MAKSVTRTGPSITAIGLSVAVFLLAFMPIPVWAPHVFRNFHLYMLVMALAAVALLVWQRKAPLWFKIAPALTLAIWAYTIVSAPECHGGGYCIVG